MGRFFNEKIQTKKKKKRKFIILLVSMGVIVFFILIILLIMFATRKKPYYVLKDSVTIEVGEKLPRISSYFSTIQDINFNKINVNASKVDVDKVGSYDVKLSINGNNEIVNLLVIDTHTPDLKLKDFTIRQGNAYSLFDFVDSCYDNSKEECILNFSITDPYNPETFVDYSSFTDIGEYEIFIEASDSSGNRNAKSAKLTILPAESVD